MTTIIPTTALLLPAAPTNSVDAAIAYWKPSIVSAYARIRSPHLLYIGVFPPFATDSRCASFDPAQKLFTALYNLIYALGVQNQAEGVDARVVLLTEDDAAFGPVMSLEQLADLLQWDMLLCPRNDQGYLLQGQFLSASTSPGVTVCYYVDAGVAQAGGNPADLEIVDGDEHTVVAGICPSLRCVGVCLRC